MPEFRQNPITKDWAIIAPTRAKREKAQPIKAEDGVSDEQIEQCVFCPGPQENLNPNACIDECSVGEKGKWEVRIIANKYPAVEMNAALETQHSVLPVPGSADLALIAQPAVGKHEVVITRAHNEPIALQSIEQIARTWKLLAKRVIALQGEKAIQYVQIFYNHGIAAGASQPHPHYQILALPFVPPHIVHEQRASGQNTGMRVHGCNYCKLLQTEEHVQKRIIFSTDSYTALSAFAARQPYEIWIIPHKHAHSFTDLAQDEFNALAATIKFVLQRLYVRLGNPALNMYVHSAPKTIEKDSEKNNASFHWHISIYPRFTNMAGLEFSTGITVNPVSPETAAAELQFKE